MKYTVTGLIITSFLMANSGFSAVLIHEVAPSANGVSTSEFVELYNTGSDPVDLQGWTLCWRTRTGTNDSGALALSGTIPAHRYFLITGGTYNNLVGTAVNGNTEGIVFPIGDLHDTGVVVGRLSASAAQLALKDASGTIVDAVGYGVEPTYTGAYVETAPKIMTSFSSKRSVSRDNATHADTNNNSVDFIYPASDSIPGAMSPENSGTGAAPTIAWNPNPANNSVNVALDKVLSWNSGEGATAHKVYFGTESPGTFESTQTASTFNPGALAPGTTYYWRIDEVTATQTLTGDVWKFETTGGASGGYVYLTWKNDPSTSIVVNWWNPENAGDSMVEYGRTNAYGLTTYNAAVTKYHHVELTDLTPGQTYHYRVKSSDGFIGSDETFTTPAANKTAFKFFVFGDTRGLDPGQDSTQYHNRHQVLCNWMASKDGEFVIQTGDMVNQGSNVDDWTNFFKAERNLGKSKVIMPAMGNHEIQGGGYYYFPDFYTAALPDNGPSGNAGKVYSFNYGNAHFVCLSSYKVDFASQRDWLIADLEATKQNTSIKWIIVYLHAPMYSSGSHGADLNARNVLGPVLNQYKVDLVFAGHNHLYERSYPIIDGVVEPGSKYTYHVTSGCGGAAFSNQLADSPDLAMFATWHGQETMAACVTINDNRLVMQAIANADDRVWDVIEITKETYLSCDFNQDGEVDELDLAHFANGWLDTGIWP
jgi:hypothetical protein